MRHYEIVFLVDPDQSEQVSAMIGRYRGIIESGKGKIHRLENWGMRRLAYPINRVYKAHYVLMNIECGQETVGELDNAFRFNDAVIRNIVIRRDVAVTEPSPLKDGGGESDAEAVPHKHRDRRETKAKDDGQSVEGGDGKSGSEVSPGGSPGGSPGVSSGASPEASSEARADDAQSVEGDDGKSGSETSSEASSETKTDDTQSAAGDDGKSGSETSSGAASEASSETKADDGQSVAGDDGKSGSGVSSGASSETKADDAQSVAGDDGKSGSGTSSETSSEASPEASSEPKADDTSKPEAQASKPAPEGD